MASFAIGERFARALIENDEPVFVKPNTRKGAPRPYSVEFPMLGGKRAKRAFTELFWRYHRGEYRTLPCGCCCGTEIKPRVPPLPR